MGYGEGWLGFGRESILLSGLGLLAQKFRIREAHPTVPSVVFGGPGTVQEAPATDHLLSVVFTLVMPVLEGCVRLVRVSQHLQPLTHSVLELFCAVAGEDHLCEYRAQAL